MFIIIREILQKLPFKVDQSEEMIIKVEKKLRVNLLFWNEDLLAFSSSVIKLQNDFCTFVRWNLDEIQSTCFVFVFV